MNTGATTTADHAPHVAEHDDHGNYLTCDKGWKSWVFTLDHKRIAVMYLGLILFAFLLGGIFALMVRTELLTPGETIMKADDYNRMFTLHGAIMTFLFIIPGIPAALGNFVLPLMLGAKDVALPRLNLASLHIYAIGAIMAVTSILAGGVDTGWTFYTPYSTTTNGAVILVTMSVFVLGFSSIFTGINFIVTVHKMRPAGMGWFNMPLMLWALYATALIQVLATPVLAITLLLLVAERALGIGIFDPALGGDPVLFQHFFWFYSHPAVYIMILPAMGVISELVAVFSRKPIFGYKAIAYSSIAIAIFSFLVWGHHMFVSGQSELAVVIFSALTFSVSIPSAVKVFNWLSTMYRGSIKLDAPMLYALAFIFLFGIGGLTGLFLATLATDVHLHDTYFIVAHFHYTMMGGVMIAFLAGIYYWWPKIFGRMYNMKWANVGAWLVFIGFNLTFFVQFVMGAKGMPRRYFNYPPEFEIYHQISSVGSYVLAAGLFLAGGVLVHSLIAGRRAPRNPFGAATLEWQAESPPTQHNFEGPLVLNDPYDYSGLAWDESEQGYVLVDRDKESVSP
jgi:cytochrome c oxidase subunit 1